MKANPELIQQLPDLRAFAFEASSNREVELLLLLLEHGLDPNTRMEKENGKPLMVIMAFDQIPVEVLDALLAKGGNPNLPFQEGWPITITQYFRRYLFQRYEDRYGDLKELWVRYYHRLRAAGGTFQEEPAEVDRWKQGLERGGLAGQTT